MAPISLRIIFFNLAGKRPFKDFKKYVDLLPKELILTVGRPSVKSIQLHLTHPHPFACI